MKIKKKTENLNSNLTFFFLFLFFSGDDNYCITYLSYTTREGEPKETMFGTSRYTNLTRPKNCFGTTLGF